MVLVPSLLWGTVCWFWDLTDIRWRGCNASLGDGEGVLVPSREGQSRGLTCWGRGGPANHPLGYGGREGGRRSVLKTSHMRRVGMDSGRGG